MQQQLGGTASIYTYVQGLAVPATATATAMAAAGGRALIRRPCSLFLVALLVLVADAATVEHTFIISNLTISRGCTTRTVAAVNGQTPGPTIEAREGDTVVVHAVNRSPYNMSIHWHGVFQRRSCWADGATMITQCPIPPAAAYTYRFNVTGQEGTLWWHAHLSFLRESVHGALIIRPRASAASYPFFPKPAADREVPVILGEWWYVDAISVDQQAFSTGGPTRPADALTINGHIGALFNCSNFTSNSNPTMHQTAAAGGGVFTSYELKVECGKTYLLRIINAALNNQLFFKIASHSFTVVAVDASYTKPYHTDVIAIAPGQTVDALLLADAPPKRYYMAARVLETADPPAPIFVDGIATAVLEYSDSESFNSAVPPALPALPASNDTATGNRFFDALRGLVRPGHPGVPLHVDERLFVTVGLGFADCLPSQALCNNTSLAASMNNVSFLFPTGPSLLQSALSPGAAKIGDEGIPVRPPVVFDFTNVSVNTEPWLAALLRTSKRTSVRKVRYNATVEMVLQNTAIIGTESHPMHIHGHNLFVVATGSGNYDGEAKRQLNLVDPVERNTVAVPGGGWAVIRFTANNPGVWFVHCHIDTHLRLGLATVLHVGNGATADAILPPPPPDFPQCQHYELRPLPSPACMPPLHSTRDLLECALDKA